MPSPACWVIGRGGFRQVGPKGPALPDAASRKPPESGGHAACAVVSFVLLSLVGLPRMCIDLCAPNADAMVVGPCQQVRVCMHAGLSHGGYSGHRCPVGVFGLRSCAGTSAGRKCKRMSRRWKGTETRGGANSVVRGCTTAHGCSRRVAPMPHSSSSHPKHYSAACATSPSSSIAWPL